VWGGVSRGLNIIIIEGGSEPESNFASTARRRASAAEATPCARSPSSAARNACTSVSATRAAVASAFAPEAA